MIVSLEKLPKRALDVLSEWEVRDTHPDDKDLERAEILLTWPNKASKEVLNKTKKLRAIQFLSAGVDDVDYSAIPRMARLFSNTDAFSVPVGEHAWALLLALAKNTCRREKAESRGLSRKTLVVLGCGGIGSEVAKKARAFDMRVLGLSRSFRNPEFFDEKHYELSHLDTLLASADAVICTLPANKFTIGILNYEKLINAKTTCIMVNVSRAEIFDKEGIMKLLKERPETRFGTDVFWRKDGRENFESKLWELNNFVGTRHRAGASGSAEVFENALVLAAENVALFLKTGNSKNEIRASDYS